MWFSLPQGVRDFPPDIAEEIRKVEEYLLEEFTRWGYRRVITPLFESLESISVGLGDELRDKILKFVDPTTGDVVALRPDITPQVGRMVAVQLRDYPKPIRLCYNGRLIRFEEKGSGKEREIFQVGCELMGLSSPEADAEIIALAVKSLEKLGIKNLVLDIGHTGFLRFLLQKTGTVRKEIEVALKKKDREALEKAISKASLPKSIKEVILSLPEFYGSRKILSKAKNIGVIRKYIKELEDVLSLLDEFELSSEINVDLGELRGFNYYTGVTFELISPDVSSPLVRGGKVR
ncbi:MAG TPA: ATP phosphoribosyltransferase regulatory subunit [Thermodesulfobacteriota bacterium]|nr:ATP phosphoribosyltransferase regulatory subunit [Thermodesulfobacteriota bacterium]